MPEVAYRERILGVTLNTPAEVPVPSGLSTWSWPLVAAAGTVALSEVAVRFVTVLAGVPLKRTWVTLARFVPETVTTVPTGPEAGLKPEMVGARMTVKATPLETPAGVVTVTAPETAPA